MNRFPTSLALLALSFAFSVSAAQPDVKKEANQIDALLAKDWQANKVKGNAPADDATFVRRIYLDIVGRIPTQRETEAFLSDKQADKRAKLIDQLLAADGYVQHMFNYWADILRLHSNSGQVGIVTGTAYANFVKESLRTNKPYDQMVRDMVGAQGKAWENGAIGYYMRDRGMPLDNMAATVRIFLGTRIECAQCHNHPFDKWTQMQFYQMAAFTYGVQTNDYYSPTQDGVRNIMREKEEAIRAKYKMPDMPKAKKDMTKEDWQAYQDAQKKVEQQRRDALEKMRKDTRYVSSALNDMRQALRYTSVRYEPKRQVSLPHDYKYPDAKPNAKVAAKTMMGQSVECPPDVSGPEAYARWMTSPENPRFTTVIANRLWKKAFGLGLIEPVDELLDSTVAENPELMKHLEKLMISVGYDMKAYLRVLYNTKTYQSAVTREEVVAGVPYHFTGPVLRRMSAEQMWDSFVALINPTPDMPNLPTREQNDRRIAIAHKLGDGLDSLTPEEMYQGAAAAGEKYRATAEKVNELQKKISEARANDDKDTVKALNKELNGYQADTRRSLNDNLYVPAVMKLASKVSGPAPAKQADTAATATLAQNDGNMMNSMMGSYGGTYEKITIPGYDVKVKTPEEEALAREAQMKVFTDEANYYGIPQKDQRDYIRFRQKVTRDWLRSAEIESPAPRGHYLREFGQSDRETIENANFDASVPQVLALMNSQLLPQILEKYSQLMLTVNKAPYPDDKVDAIFTALLSRKPTPAEKEKWIKAQEKGLADYEDLIYALINTQQFIFIQ